MCSISLTGVLRGRNHMPCFGCVTTVYSIAVRACRGRGVEKQNDMQAATALKVRFLSPRMSLAICSQMGQHMVSCQPVRPVNEGEMARVFGNGYALFLRTTRINPGQPSKMVKKMRPFHFGGQVNDRHAPFTNRLEVLQGSLPCKQATV